MTTKAKKQPRAPKNRLETAEVDVLGKSVKASPLAAYQFKPGNHANPLGRPKTADLKAAVREFADEADPKIRKTRLRQWLEICDRRARQGSPKHLELLLGYGWGRPAQAMELTGGLDLSSTIAEARQRVEAHRAAEAPLPALPASTDANGAIRRAQAAAEAAEQGTASEDAAEQPAKPKIRVEPWAN